MCELAENIKYLYQLFNVSLKDDKETQGKMNQRQLYFAAKKLRSTVHQCSTAISVYIPAVLHLSLENH